MEDNKGGYFMMLLVMSQTNIETGFTQVTSSLSYYSFDLSSISDAPSFPRTLRRRLPAGQLAAGAPPDVTSTVSRQGMARQQVGRKLAFSMANYAARRRDVLAF